MHRVGLSDANLQAERPNDLEELHLPGPNEFVPTRLDVDKREVDQVSDYAGFELLQLNSFPPALKAATPDPPNTLDNSLAQEGRSVLDP